MANKALRLSGSLTRLGTGCALALALLGACDKADWQSPDYVSQQLLEQDPTKRRLALEKLKELPAEAQNTSAVVAALVKVYQDGGTGQKEVMTLLVKLRHPEAAPAYLKELETNATGFAGAAGEALGTTKSTASIPGMLATLKATDNNEVKEGILRGLSMMPDPSVVGPLVDILGLDVDNFPIAHHAWACEILGATAMAHPGAFDDKAREAMVRAIYLANNRGQNVGKECGLAVQQLGPQAAPALLKAFNGQHEGVNNLLLSYNRPPDFGFTANHTRAVATVRLSGMRAPEAVASFIQDLKKVKAAPSEISGQHAVSWRLKEGQLTDEIILGLGDLGDASARPVLEDVLLGKRNKDWDDITDGLIELQLRQDAAQALNRLGDRAALPSLMKMAREGVIIDLERRFAMLEKAGKPGSLVERYQFNWMAAQAYANLARPEQRAEYQKLIAETKQEELRKKYESFLVMFDTAEQCEAKGDDAARAACYAEKLASEDPLVREKASYELGRLPAAVAGPVIAKALSTKHLDTRELLTAALYRAPSKQAIAAIDAILEAEASRTGPEYNLDRNRLHLAKAWLHHQKL